MVSFFLFQVCAWDTNFLMTVRKGDFYRKIYNCVIVGCDVIEFSWKYQKNKNKIDDLEKFKPVYDRTWHNYSILQDQSVKSYENFPFFP